MKNRSAQKKPRKHTKRHNQSRSGRPGNTETGRLLLYGIHTIATALENKARKKHRLLVTKNAAARLHKQIAKIGTGLDIYEAMPADIDRLVGNDAVHQGALLECDVLPPKSLQEMQIGTNLVILDQISDPHNVGAIMRSCVAMGVGALVTTNRSSAPQTAVLAKSASGALDLIDLIEVGNLSKAIEILNAQGYQTIGLDSEGPKILENSIDPGIPHALVLGAEGKGLRQKTRDTCTTLARLDMPGKIKSLNVSNAATLALYVIQNSSLKI